MKQMACQNQTDYNQFNIRDIKVGVMGKPNASSEQRLKLTNKGGLPYAFKIMQHWEADGGGDATS